MKTAMPRSDSRKTAALLIGFGGPTSLEEVRPFLASIVGDSKVPSQRVEEVYRHYELIGGVSPFNAITEKQKSALEQELKARGLPLPVGVAYRHSTPSFRDAFETFRKFGVERVVGLVLASFRSFVSREWYYEKLEEGRRLALAGAIEVRYTAPFDQDARYLRAQRERMEEVLSAWTEEEKRRTSVIFTAHAIPSFMCERSCGENENRCYGFQFYEACRSIARDLGLRPWTLCYQSQSGSPREKWLGPDVKEVIRALDPKKTPRLLVVPVGFLCDNVEVIYDLDREARAVAESGGFAYFRAGTVGDHPLFIEMMADKIKEALKDEAVLFPTLR
jgi:ferrochelatase